MERRRWLVFLDTSALIAGILSPTGAAHEVLRLCEAGLVQTLISRQVLVEADRTLSAKVPTLLSDHRTFLKRLSPLVVEDPSRDAVEQAGDVIHDNDAPILAAAMESGWISSSPGIRDIFRRKRSGLMRRSQSSLRESSLRHFGGQSWKTEG
jgi:predicted nucleic acid-binding protein